MASVYKPDNSRYWWYRFQRDRIRFRGSTKKTTRAAAKRVLARALKDFDQQREAGPQYTYDAAVNRFADEHLPMLKISTQGRYLTSFRQLQPYFEGKSLNSISSGCDFAGV